MRLQVQLPSILASTLASSTGTTVASAALTLGSTLAFRAALRTTRVDDHLERGGLRSEWCVGRLSLIHI